MVAGIGGGTPVAQPQGNQAQQAPQAYSKEEVWAKIKSLSVKQLDSLVSKTGEPVDATVAALKADPRFAEALKDNSLGMYIANRASDVSWANQRFEKLMEHLKEMWKES